MELFPASSEQQWKLIRRVIDDCYYYVVIIAGCYESLGPNGKSYTEMEFDYALAAGKSVLGFYHADPDSLVGYKLEKSDERRKRLAAFTRKVKTIFASRGARRRDWLRLLNPQFFTLSSMIESPVGFELPICRRAQQLQISKNR